MKHLENFMVFNHDVKAQLKRFIYDRSEELFAAGDQTRDAITSKAELEARNNFLREKFIEGLGGLPPMDTPLNPQVTGTVQCEGFRIEKVIFESRPKTYVTANLYIPDCVTGPTAAVLFVCGHHHFAKHHPEYQSVCMHLALTGLVVLAQDPIGQGERLSYYESAIGGTTVDSCTIEHSYAGAQCLPLGDGIARYFVHDSMRAIDYLISRPEVDPAKIGVTGNSGGGTQTSLLMVCDPRIAAAAPATFIMNRRTYMYAGGAQDSEQIWPGVTAYGFDHEDILLAMSPRPVRVLSVNYDFFPIEGARSTVKRVKRFWEMCDKGDAIDHVEDASEHEYTVTLQVAAAQFFSKHLLGEQVTTDTKRVNTLDPSQLWCTPTGQIRAHYPDSRSIHDENCDRAAELERSRKDLRSDAALDWLREKVFANRRPVECNPRHNKLGKVEELLVKTSIWWTQENLFSHAFTFVSDYKSKRLPLTIAVWDRGTKALRSHLEWVRKTCASGRAVMVLDVSGVGPLSPHSLNHGEPEDHYGILYKLNDDLIWMNDSMAAMRIYDVIRAIDMASREGSFDAEDIQLYAKGRQGMYAQLAAALDERVKCIEVVDGMESAADWVTARHYNNYDISGLILPGMLKYFDLSDLPSSRY